MTAENVPNAPQQSRNQTNRHWILQEAAEEAEESLKRQLKPRISRIDTD